MHNNLISQVGKIFLDIQAYQDTKVTSTNKQYITGMSGDSSSFGVIMITLTGSDETLTICHSDTPVYWKG